MQEKSSVSTHISYPIAPIKEMHNEKYALSIKKCFF